MTVSTRSTGISLVVEVTDEGPGVPAELGARIFERAVSGRRSTGLGLAVARELAESEGGRLELVQQKPADVRAVPQRGGCGSSLTGGLRLAAARGNTQRR